MASQLCWAGVLSRGGGRAQRELCLFFRFLVICPPVLSPLRLLERADASQGPPLTGSRPRRLAVWPEVGGASVTPRCRICPAW